MSRIRNIISEEKLSCGEISAFHVWQLWGNWKFLHIWRNFRCKNKQYVQFMGFYCNLCRFVAKSVIHAVLSRNLFCHNLRAFMWRKIEPKSTFVQKKWQISGLMLGSFGFSISYFERDVREEHVSNITISNKVICGWVIFVHIIVKSLPTTLEMISDNKFQNTMRYCTIPQSTLHSI